MAEFGGSEIKMVSFEFVPGNDLRLIGNSKSSVEYPVHALTLNEDFVSS